MAAKRNDPDRDSDDLPDLTDSLEPVQPTAALATTREHALVRRFTVRVVSGPDAGLVASSRGERVVIGSHRSADLRLADRAVSRFHCELTMDEGRVLLRDLESRNGTRVDGVEVRVAPLRPGALLTLGDDSVRYEPGDDHVRIPLSDRAHFGAAVGQSARMRSVFATLEQVAASDATVLLWGETGTGKDVLAEAIHDASPRARAPFVVVDCGALPPALLESELFGHEKGAFTGADRRRAGAFEAAAGGTLFLDEIGELALELQPKLLGALERREIQRVGGTQRLPVDVRIVAATSRQLRQEVNARRFRSDLYYRLAVVQVALPALRERREDLPLLAAKLCEHLAGGAAAGQAAWQRLGTPAFLATLARHEWPGNVRELRNYLERCLAHVEGETPAPGGSGEAAAATPAVDISLPIRDGRERAVAWFERRYLEELLRATGGNVTAAARSAGVNRMQLYRLLWRAGLR
jgi:two-component system response regulator GlrR